MMEIDKTGSSKEEAEKIQPKKECRCELCDLWFHYGDFTRHLEKFHLKEKLDQRMRSIQSSQIVRDIRTNKLYTIREEPYGNGEYRTSVSGVSIEEVKEFLKWEKVECEKKISHLEKILEKEVC